MNGLRINFRDSDLERVNGVNLTVWTPYKPESGTVKGLALGVPVTGAAEIDGVATGVLGVGAKDRIRGVTFAPIGAGAGNEISGIAIGGIGLGAGGDLKGIMIGGVGAGAGGSLNGIVLGGVGAGAGHDATGLIAGGVGAGVGGSLHGLALGGLGVGAGGGIRGVAIAGLGVGSPRLDGGFVALAVGARDASGIVIAPALFKIERGGSFTGGTVSTVNYIRGSQRGIAIGVVNYARTLNGVQIGVVNIVGEAKGHPVLPIFNWGSR